MLAKIYSRSNYAYRCLSRLALCGILIIFIRYLSKLRIPTVLNLFLNNASESVKTRLCHVQQCTQAQSDMHGALYASMAPEWSSCYADSYLTALDQHDAPVRTLMDVGANKAYAVAAWLAFFLPQLNIDQARLGQYLTSSGKVTYPCGSCNDCQDPPLRRQNGERPSKLEIHAFEPQPGTVSLLRGVQAWMNVSGRSDSVLEIHGVAVSEYVRTSTTVRLNHSPFISVARATHYSRNATRATKYAVWMYRVRRQTSKCKSM